MARWALSTALTLAATSLFGCSAWFWAVLAVFGSIGVLAVLFWLTPLGRAAFAQFEREELAKRRDRLDARLRELDGRNHGASSAGG